MLIRSVDNDSQRHMAWCISAPIPSAALPNSGLLGIEYRWDKINESIPNIQSNISIRCTAFKGTTLRGEILRRRPPPPVLHFRVFLFYLVPFIMSTCIQGGPIILLICRIGRCLWKCLDLRLLTCIGDNVVGLNDKKCRKA
jgi:hypothetical protein